MYIQVVLILLTIAIGLIFSLYWIPKKLGYPKVGKYIGITVSLLFLFVTLFLIFEDNLFFKRDARALLAEQDIYLNDDFEIVKNSSMWAMGDSYHTFILRISERDKLSIIGKIKKSEHFIGINGPIADILHATDRYFGKRQIQNYESKLQFVREYFEPSGKQGYAPIYRIIEINKNDNQLIFEDIDE